MPCGTASICSEVCHAVGTQPCLQPLSGEHLQYKTIDDPDEARLDFVAVYQQKDFSGINPFSKSYANTPLSPPCMHALIYPVTVFSIIIKSNYYYLYSSCIE